MEQQNKKIQLPLTEYKYSTINKYIYSLNTDDKSKFLYLVSEFIDKCDFYYVFKVIEKVLNNDKVIDVLKSYEEDGKLNISNVPTNYKTNTFTLIVSMYCDFNNVELIDDSFKSVFDDYESSVFSDMLSHPILSASEENDLFLKYKNGDEKAREKIINSNYKLVKTIASKYVSRYISYDDLFQEGVIGLMKAVSNFDVSRNFKFSTYAIWWIRQVITRYVQNNKSTIRKPAYISEKLSKFKKAEKKLFNTYGRKPTVSELSCELGVSQDEVLEMMEMRDSDSIISLNTIIDDENNKEVGDFIKDEYILEDEVIKNLSESEIKNIIDKIDLKKREKEIIFLRLGLYDGCNYTLEQVGNKYDITRERVRQIEEKTLKRINNYLKAHKILDFNEKKELDELHIIEFEECEDINKFDPSRFNPKFPDGTSMGKWFFDNQNQLINSKEEKYKNIQEQYEKYKLEKRREKEQKQKEARERFFSERSSFGTVKYISISGEPQVVKSNVNENNESFYDMFDATPKQVDYVLDKYISKYKRKLILKKWNQNLNSSIKEKDSLTATENNIYLLTIEEIKNLLNKSKISDRSYEEEKGMKRGKKLNPIYELLSDYSKEQVDDAIGKLDEKDKDLLFQRYGNDLENPVTQGVFGRKEANRFYGHVLPKIKKLLNHDKTSEPNKNENKTSSKMIEVKQECDDNEVYLKIYELFNMPYFVYALSKIDPRDYKALFLKINYPDKSLDEIAGFTGIDKEKLIISLQKAANELKKTIDDLINEAFGISDSDELESVKEMRKNNK